MAVEEASRSADDANTSRNLGSPWFCTPLGASAQDCGTTMSPVSSSVITQPTGPSVGAVKSTPLPDGVRVPVP